MTYADPERQKEYNRNRARAYRKTEAGKESRRRYVLKSAYGITPEIVRALEIAQQGECYVCGRTGKLHIDHDHETGRIRGLACGTCNRAIGILGDTAESLRYVAARMSA